MIYMEEQPERKRLVQTVSLESLESILFLTYSYTILVTCSNVCSPVSTLLPFACSPSCSCYTVLQCVAVAKKVLQDHINHSEHLFKGCFMFCAIIKILSLAR